MIEKQTGVVYRKEQFEAGTGLREELIVRDRRYTAPEIEALCQRSGLPVIWSRYVRAGHWYEEEDSERAKEILVLCRKSASKDVQIGLFD